MSKKSKNTHKLITICSFSVAIISIFILFFANLLSERTSHETTGEAISSVDYLSCVSTEKIESVFSVSNASKIENKVKILFKNDIINEIMYSLSGTYINETTMEKEGGHWQAEYNLYLGESGIKPSSIDSTIYHTKTNAWANLITKPENLNVATAKLFLLDENQLTNIGKAGMNTLKKYYEGKRFTCETHKNNNN